MGAVLNLEANMSETAKANANRPTGGELRLILGQQPRTFQKAWKVAFGYAFDTSRECTPQEVAKMQERFPSKGQSKKETLAGKSVRPGAIVSPVITLPRIKWPSAEGVYLFFVRSFFAAAVIAHAGLVWSEVAYLWKGNGVTNHENPGFIAGGLWFVFTIGAVVSWTRRSNQELQMNLLWAIVALDIGAGFIHYYALHHIGTNAFGAGIRSFETGFFAAGFSIMAMGSAYFYKEHAK